MIRSPLFAALFSASLAAACLSAPAAAVPQSPATGVSVRFDRHGLQGVSLDWSAGRYARPAVVGRPRYERFAQSPGHYAWRSERVWVPAARRKVWNEPIVRTHYDACGRRIETVVRAGRWSIETVPGHFEERQVKVWVADPAIVCRY